MTEPQRKRSSDTWTGLASVGMLAFAIGCCAALPLIVAVAGSIAIGTVLGVGAGSIALVALIAMVVGRARRRVACETPEPSELSEAARRELT